MSVEESRKPKWWKGAIGFVALLVVILGGSWALIRFENTQSIKDTQEAMETATAAPAQCYAPTAPMDFTTGNPRNDLILYTMLTDNPDSLEALKFVKTYKDTGALDSQNALWVAAAQKVQETTDVDVRVYLQMDVSGNLLPKEDDGTRYIPIVVAPAAGTQAEWDVAGIAKVTNGTAESESQKIIIGVSDNGVVIPVENGENSQEQEYGLVSVSPVC